MTLWRPTDDVPAILHCPIALEMLDDFTGWSAIGSLQLTLEFQDGPSWRPSDLESVRTDGGLYAYPGLGRHADPAAAPSFRVRILVTAANYRPEYGATLDGLEYDVPTYNDTVPPAFLNIMPESVVLLPASNYPYPPHVRVLRGTVRNSGTGDPLADARVSTGLERALTDERGAFSLPLRWQPTHALINVLAEHPRTGLTNSVSLQLPDVLGSNQEILVS